MGCKSSKPGAPASNRSNTKSGSADARSNSHHNNTTANSSNHHNNGSVGPPNDNGQARGSHDLAHANHHSGGNPNTNSNSNHLSSSSAYDASHGRFATCHFCYDRILEKDLNAHTVMCSEREVTCWNSWCRRMMKQSELAKHMEECSLLQKALCPKCGDEVLATEMVMHRDTCHPQPCPRCGEVCIKRIVACCPHAIFAARSLHRGPFATEALQKRYMALNPSPESTGSNVYRNSSGSSGDSHNTISNYNKSSNSNSNAMHSINNDNSITNARSLEYGKANYNVARMQLLWRWLKCRSLIEEAIFRNVNKEMDLKKEGFAIFKAHDKANDVHVLAPKRSRSVIQAPVVAPATSSHYFPVNPNIPITQNHVELLISDVKKRVLLPYPAAWRVFMGAMNHLNTLPNVVRLSPVIGARMINGRMIQGSKVVVVGDLHGQLGDLLHILDECGMPGESNYYVFNGDFVDRGPSSVEILLILFSLMLAFPTNVTLNRGNHECDYMNDEYGFDVEVSTKYDRNVFRLIQRCFCALPLATILDSKVFIVHGGLPRRKGVTINDISRIQRFRQIPIPDYSQPEEDEIFQDLLWSDPVDDITGWRDSQRGAGVEFGADLTEEFLRNNHLELVVRSHEECLSGYQEYHNRRLITVFSASNYDGPESNYGAVCTFIRDNIEPTFITYQTFDEEERDVQTTAANLVDSIALTSSNVARMSSFAAPFGRSICQLIFRRSKNDIVRVLRERIYQRRHRLMVYYSKLDRTNKGSVWMIEWVECMRNVLNLDLPWHFLRGYLTEVDGQSRVWYSPFLRSFHNLVQELWVENWKQGVCARLVQQQRVNHRSRLVSTAFNKEVVSYSEFCSVLRAIDYTISECQLFQLFQLFDDEGTGHVSGPLFIKKMQLIANSKPDAMRWDMDSMEQLQNIVIQARSQLGSLFKVTPREKMLTREKFMAGMAQLARGMRKQLTQAQKDAIFDYIRQLSQSTDDVINFDAFLLCVCVFDSRMMSDYKLALFMCLLELGMAPSPLKNSSFNI